MIYPFADKLENLGSKYALVVLAAKRAKQVKSGVPPAIDTDSRNPLTIALEEIAHGKIGCSVPDNDLIVTTSVEPEVAQLLAIPGREDEEFEAEAGAVVEHETPLAIEGDTHADDEEVLDEWEEESDEEDEVLPLDKHLENGIIIDPDEDSEEENVEAVIDEEPKPKTRGRRKAAQPEPDEDIHVADEADLDIDLEEDADPTDEE